MSESYRSSYTNRKPYIPASLSEIYDLLAPMVGEAPTYIDETGAFPDQNIDSRFYQLVESFGIVRKKLGEERYAAVIDLAARAKALFLEDPADENGKTDKGTRLIYEIEDIIQSVRKGRVKARAKDEEGRITGD